ncbi:hypothetical protein [Psychrobacter sp. LV10R520-6]|uniref:hypothetical protein n=1 Tax=Psychrobacter sp. LV10R520-6 TaxID=1415574 RepID=UPI0024C528E2|nr:hypothetical protein [Psychrobacter sp. LV10R520-6]SNT71405.1 hypothetical protein SAMN04488491_2646 [Psychrobacter sp. LV10R520-6]
MKLGPLKQLRASVLVTGLLASAISLSACQQQQEPEPSLGDSISAEQSAPMSAEPAEPNDMAVTTEDASLNEVQDDTVATVNTGVTQMTYLCALELKIEATYKDEANQVFLATDQGILTLTKTNEGSNPEVFEVATALDGGEGFTQWRVAHEDRATGVMRMAGADETNVNTYECNKT